MNISFITICKNRLHHLQQTLPLMVAQQPFEIIVVDYGCPQGTGDWVRDHFPAVKVVHVSDDPGFCAARARNLGAAAARGDWLVFIDADVKVQGDWVGWMRTHLQLPWFYRASQNQNNFDKEIYGTFICAAKTFSHIKGYDEFFRGWGGEDVDIYKRLKMEGFPINYYPDNFLEAIPHSDDERVTYAENKTRGLNHVHHEIYTAIKHQIIHTYQITGDLSDDLKDKIMKKVKLVLTGLSSDENFDPIKFNFDCSKDVWLPDPYKLKKKINMYFEIDLKK